MRRIERSLIALSFVLPLAGCGGDPPRPLPASIDVRAEPARLWYHEGQDVALVATVLDTSGEARNDVELVWEVTPAAAAAMRTPGEDPSRARFTLTAAGSVTITGCVAPQGAEIEPRLCDSVALRVDDGMPAIELETPAPGAELDDPEGIVVRGSVADRSMSRVYVNGAPVALDGLGRFEATVPAAFGANHLRVDASDGLTEVSTLEMDVMWASLYTPATGEDGRPSLTLQDGLALRLGPGFFDDGVPLDLGATPVQTRDLADLLELVVVNLETAGLVPDPVVDSPPTFTLRVPALTLGAPRAELAPTDDGVDLFLRIGAVQATTEGALVIEGTSLPLEGTIRASAVAFARLVVRKESEDAELVVEVSELEVAIESVAGDFASDETDAVFALAAGLLRTTLEDTLLGAVRETVESSVPAVLRDALSAIDGALAGQRFSLGSEPFPPITIALDGRIRSLDTVHERELLATLRTTIGTDVPSVRPDSRGVARIDERETRAAFFRDGSLALGVRLAVLNGLLHALWSSGLLDLDVSPLLPEAVTGLVSQARLEGRMAPVLRPPGPSEDADLVLSVGQLELDLVFQGAPARFAVRLDAGVRIDVIDDRVVLDVAEIPEILVWTLVPASNPRLLSPELVRTLLLDLWPDLRASVVEGLALELPLPQVGDLGGLAPGLAGLTLSLETEGRIRPRGEALLLEARLVGRLP